MSTRTGDTADAPGQPHYEEMQLSPLAPKRLLEGGEEYSSSHHLPSAHMETILEMKSVHLDYDDRDKGEYEPAPKRTRTGMREDNHDSFYDERRKSPAPRSPRNRNSRRNWGRSRSRSRSRTPSRTRGRDRSRRRSRSPSRSPRRPHRYSKGRSRSRSPERSRSRNRTRRHDRSPRDRSGSNARERRGSAQFRRDRPSFRNGGHDYDREPSPSYKNKRYPSGGGGRSIPEPTRRDAARIKPDVTLEERKRGQRLFGGLLANLGGPAAKPRSAARLGLASQRPERVSGASNGRLLSGRPVPAAKARAQPTPPEHIGRRNAEEEDSSKTATRLAKLERIRTIEQVRFDEQKMHTLQANKLALAQSLQTKSKPQLFYRPRLLSKEQEDTIAGQLRDAEDRTHQESLSFAKEKHERLSALGVQYTPKGSTSAEEPLDIPKQVQEGDESVAEAHAEPDAMVVEPTADQVGATSASPERPSSPIDRQQEDPKPQGDKAQEELSTHEQQPHDREGHREPEEPRNDAHPNNDLDDNHDDRDKDVMDETEEDTVIY